MGKLGDPGKPETPDRFGGPLTETETRAGEAAAIAVMEREEERLRGERDELLARPRPLEEPEEDRLRAVEADIQGVREGLEFLATLDGVGDSATETDPRPRTESGLQRRVRRRGGGRRAECPGKARAWAAVGEQCGAVGMIPPNPFRRRHRGPRETPGVPRHVVPGPVHGERQVGAYVPAAKGIPLRRPPAVGQRRSRTIDKVGNGRHQRGLPRAVGGPAVPGGSVPVMAAYCRDPPHAVVRPEILGNYVA